MLAFLVGLFYYQRNKSKPTYYLVLFLGITAGVEILGWYAYFVPSGFLSFLKDTVFKSNYWLYNIYNVVSYVFYISYFKWQLRSKRAIKILNHSIVVFITISVFEILFSGGYFIRFSSIATIVGTLLVFLSIGLYYMQLLKSDEVLRVHKILPFYISIGALLFHLCTTPIFIYNSYYSLSMDPSFVEVYRIILFGSNYVLYGIFILGFLICKEQKQDKTVVA